VKEDEFRSLIKSVGLRIVEERIFNTDLKSVYRFVPPDHRAEFMVRWLDLELYLNSLGIPYRDSMATVFYTRNFVLAHDDSPANPKSLV
jgi:hypothetical protein